MKQTFKTAKTVAMGLLAICTFGLSAPTFAQTKTATPTEFKFIGKINSQPVFQLSLDKDAAEVYLITLKDQNNEVIYSEKVNAKDVNYSRKYQLALNDEDLNASDFGVKVEITSAKTHETEVYRISAQTSVRENIIVAKL
jgi:hypothetical protein